MTYEKTFEVRWSEIDVNWHMRNTSYAELGTSTRVAFLAENGFPPEQFIAEAFGPVVLRDETKYMREVRLGNTLTYTLQLSGQSADGSHFEMHHDVLLDGGVKAAVLRVEGSWMDLSTRRLRTPPKPILDAMRLLDRTADYRELRSLARPKS